jgi:hypothetical protein
MPLGRIALSHITPAKGTERLPESILAYSNNIIFPKQIRQRKKNHIKFLYQPTHITTLPHQTALRICRARELERTFCFDEIARHFIRHPSPVAPTAFSFEPRFVKRPAATDQPRFPSVQPTREHFNPSLGLSDAFSSSTLTSNGGESISAGVVLRVP